MDEEDYLKGLHLRDKELYNKLKRDCIDEKLKLWDAKEKESHKTKLERGINQEIRHETLINNFIYPFIQKDRIRVNLGYKFIRPEPLIELGMKNFDSLIFNEKSKVAIFVEVKSSIGNPHDVIKEILEQKQCVEDYLGYIEENYLENDIKRIEYVIAVPAEDSDNLFNRIEEKDISIIVWQRHIIHELPGDIVDPKEKYSTKLKLKTPPKSRLGNAMHKGVVHGDDQLVKELGKGVFTSGTTNFSVFPSSPMLSYLKLINILSKIRGKDRFFYTDDLKDFLYDYDLRKICRKDEFRNRSCKFIENKIEMIIKMGLEINFIRNTDTENEFKIVSKHTGIKDIENNTLIPKYIDYKLGKAKEAYKNKILINCYEETKLRLEKEGEPQIYLD